MGGTVLLESGISNTIKTLRQAGLNVSVIGQVPAYDVDVPFELARNLGHLSGAKELEPSADSFGPVLAGIAKKWGATYVDVASVMCTPNCEVQRDGQSLYRDDGHLSSMGALAHISLIDDAINGRHGSMVMQQGMRQ